MSELKLAIPLLVTGEAGGALAVIGLWSRGVYGAAPFAVLMAAAGWWAVAQALGLFAEDAAGKFAWLRVQYAGAVLIVPAWVALVIQFRRRQPVVPDRLLGWLAVEPIVMMVLV